MARNHQFARGDGHDPFDQIGIACCAKADIVREDGRTQQVGVAMHRVDPPDDRDRDIDTFGIGRCVPIGVSRGEPCRRIGIG